MSDEKKEVAAPVQEAQEAKAPEAQDTKVNLDDEKRAGIKEAAVDAEAIAAEMEKPKAENEKAAFPSFFVEKDDRRKIEIDVLSSREDGRILSASWTGLGLDFTDESKFLRHEKVWFEFTIPSYEDMFSYRQRSASFRKEAGQMMVDRLQLRNHLVIWHLKDWSLTNRKGEKIVLKHDDDGSLSDESSKIVYTIHPTILDVVMTRFEKDVLMT